MARKKGYQLFDVPNTSRGHRFVQDINDFINRDWYGYQRRGRSPKPGVPLNSQGQSRVLDSSGWAIYVRGVPVSKEFLEHSAAKRNDEIMKLYHKEFDDRIEAQREIRALNDDTYELERELKKLNRKFTYRKISLFGWNISLWRDDKDAKPS